MSRITPQKTQPTHAEQLAKFRKAWNYIETYFNNDDKKPIASHVSQTEISLHLKTMVDLLADEGLMLEDVNTGLCMEEFLRNNILKELVTLAKPDVPKGIRGEIISTVAQMINLLDDRFLVHNAVHQPTVQLLRTCVHDEGERYDEKLVDLMYTICSKIHAFPDLLNIFFHDTHWLTTPFKAYIKKEAGQASFSSSSSQDGNFDDGASISTNVTTSATKTTEFTEEPEKPEYEFLLFSYLLQFLHREELAEGQLGDFILESDFATIMAAGLGALYSQLPRKLMVKSSSGGLTNATLLGFGDNTHAELERLRSGGIEVSSSPVFKSQLDSFLKLLEFCQDVLNICPNVDISIELLKSVKTNFLENILYPSILECSDTDGSAVAVISYIDIIMQTLNQEELVDVVVGFLMDSDGDDEEFWKQTTTTSKMSKRQSTINLFEGIENNQIKSSPYFISTGRFTLKDLIFSRLRSSSQQAVIATLKLLHTVISKHCRYSLKLLNIELDENATCFPRPNYLMENSCNVEQHGSISSGQPKLTTISHHLRELDLFFDLISAIDPTQNMEIFTNGYDSYVRDAEMIIEADRCYINGQDVEWTEDGPIRPKSNKSNRQRLLTYSHGKGGKKGAYKGISAVPKHRLVPTNPGDSLLQILVGTLSNFFAHSPELNLTLTGVLSALAVCPYRSLEGWLVFSGVDRLDSRRESSMKDIENLQYEPRNLESSLGINNHGSHSISDGDDKAIDDFNEDDDRSVDYNADKSPSAAKAIGATPMWTNFPPFFTIFKTLTQQVDYYRSEIDGFNQYLEDRRNGLLDADDEIDENFFKQQPSFLPSRTPTKKSPTPSSSSQSSRARRNTTHSSSSPNHTPRRTNSLSRAESSMGSAINSPLSSFSKSSPASSSNISTPLSTHFRKTENIKIQPLFPTHFVNEEEEEDSIDYGDEEDEDGFASRKQTRTKTKEPKPKEITLSTLLNNVVILEEAIKELVAIVQVRRSLGVDEVRYL
ncbi:Retinoic acid induced 16-like protein [Glomus cerebriforme]|uniref:Retinoic acid induced 16-like protein n=1 Tax=Glomus cerebriforme TaxID=658196 RepID=A0A397SUL5_9GLOM|nr:Retinoic acid induced 16-like protein [Glomus cerebriforme]